MGLEAAHDAHRPWARASGCPRARWATPRSGISTSGRARSCPQDLARIDKAVEDGTLAENEVLQAALKDAQRVHLIGLVSDGGVHSSVTAT